MKLFPYENFCIYSELTPADAIERIENEIEPSREFSLRSLFSKPDTNGYFSGFILNGTFSLTPIINYRNSFLPDITGTIVPQGDGCKIRVQMALSKPVFLFMCIWLGGISIVCIGSIIQCLINWSFNWAILFGFGMFLVGYGIMTGGFKAESGDAQKKLLSITEGVIEQ